MNNVNEILETPWKITNELMMYLIKPFVVFYLKFFCKVVIGKNPKFYGFPKIFRNSKGLIKIGNNFECRSWWFSNPLGLNHPTIICAWSPDSKIIIGDDVGVSGGAIVASKSVTIGNGSILGANSEVLDTDFHPLGSSNRRYDKNNIKSQPIVIGNNVFIGMNALVLKGVTIADNKIIPAGSVVRSK